jgi:iron-sulfur cluster repair protein YtfE (RIC family)
MTTFAMAARPSFSHLPDDRLNSARGNAAVALPHPHALFGPQLRRAELVAAYPDLDEVCERMGFGFSLTLGEWSSPPRWALLALARAAQPPGPQPVHDWSMATIPELIRHITETHHIVVRNELARLGLVIDNLATAQAAAMLTALRKVFSEFREEMLLHLEQEEHGLFPLCIRLEEASLGHCTWEDEDVTTLIRYANHGHLTCDSGLHRALELAEAAMRTIRDPDLAVIVAGLLAMQQDLAAHTAKEGELLIPAAIFAEERILAREGRAPRIPISAADLPSHRGQHRNRGDQP